VLRKLLILALFIASLTACTSATPAPLVAETPQIQAETPGGQRLAKESAPATTPTPLPTITPTATGDLKLTILFDNYPFDSRLSTQWGFAALVEYHGHTLLFDTGADGSMLLENMKQLGVDPRSVEAVVISHMHDDHTGGLQALLDTGSRPTVYTPPFSGLLKSVGAQTKLVEVADALEVFPGVHATGPVNFEQALVVETRDGSVVITGCAHPGVAKMVRRAQEVVPGKVALLAGGFHLYETSKEKLPSIVAELRQLGVEKVLACHCTGDEAIALFRAEYGENYVQGGVGRAVTLPGKKLD
jgi:7,8-dihydropterin-6-yl-methyl-4-(beta-D-ribofuranosyl)aminobenzene 5'-phosphate synthase